MYPYTLSFLHNYDEIDPFKRARQAYRDESDKGTKKFNQEHARKREAAKSAYKVKKQKDRTIMQCKELEFLTLKTDDMPEEQVALINMKKDEIMKFIVRFKKKLQILKKKIRLWVNDYRKKQYGHLEELRSNLRDIDKELDQGGTNEVILQRRLEILKNLHDINSANACDYMQKAKIQWAIEGDENSKFFHGIINRKRANLAIKGVMVDGDWVDDPCRVKEEFRLHFANRFRAPVDTRYKLNYTFPNKLQPDQMDTLESPVSRDEVRNAMWGCGENKSPGPDGFSFEFFRKFWDTV
ncbi:hypothetical protein Tco_1390127, partial [Tanacetum coccineum]